jgi:2-oxoglutarate dehydrogenase E2 component (dihydrolipoamide succinyltransferase)
MAIEVKVPVLGESITEATVGQWLKKPGEAVAADEPIASLETDKVAIDVPAPSAGVMGDLVAAEGDTVEVGAIIAYIQEGAGAPAKAAAPAAAPAPAKAPEPEQAEAGSAALTLSPAVRRLVLEHGLDPSSIKGSGKDGRLTKDDVMAAVEAGRLLPPSPPPARKSASA